MENDRFRLTLILLFSVSVNVAYIAFQLLAGVYYRTGVFYAPALYHLLLTLLRVLLLRGLLQHPSGSRALRQYRLYGIALLAMSPLLIIIVALIVYAEQPLVFRGATTLVLSLYTVGSFYAAIRGTRKYRKQKSPLPAAVKSVSLTNASVSLLSLEIALLFTFGSQRDLFFRRTVTGISGAAVLLFILALSLRMIRGRL